MDTQPLNARDYEFGPNPWQDPQSYRDEIDYYENVALHYRREARKAKWLGRFGFANRAGRASTEPQSSFRLGLSATIAIACVALSLLAVAYFAWQFLGRPGL
jgi:hypothetical protein